MKKYLVLLILLIFFSFSTIVFAQATLTTTSNEVVTKVGTPPVPTGGGGTTGPVGPSGLSISCPLGSSFSIGCGSAANPINGCGHGGVGYPQPCNPALYVCPYSVQLKHAYDVTTGGSSLPVAMPFINDQSVTWAKVATVPIGGGWGFRQEYQTVIDGKTVKIDFTHLSDGSGAQSLTSGQSLGNTVNNLDGGGTSHLHTAVQINGEWVEPPQANYCSK